MYREEEKLLFILVLCIVFSPIILIAFMLEFCVSKGLFGFMFKKLLKEK